MARRQEDEESLDAELEAEEQEEGAWLRVYLQKTPWWLLSIVLHGLVLGCLGLITFSKAVIFDDAPIEVFLAGRTEAKLEDKPRPRALIDTRSLASEAPPSDSPKIFAPDFEVSDTVESDDDDDARQMKGVSLDDLSALSGESGGVMGRQPSDRRGLTDVAGVGAGGGSAGRHGGPRGGRRNSVTDGMNDGSESAVTEGLHWLARHQRADGSWPAAHFDQGCASGTRCSGPGVEQFDVGTSGLALLAFLGAGYTQSSRASYLDPHLKRKVVYGPIVAKGLAYLIGQQDAQGCFGRREGEYMYNHSIAALALAEAYGMSQSAVGLREPAQRGIDFVVAAQNPGLGWRYRTMPGDNDTSCTGWAVMALKSAMVSGLDVPREAFGGARAWLDRVTDPSGQVGYTAMGTVDVFVPGKNEEWRSHPSMTAIGLLLRIYIDGDARDPMLARGAKLLMADLPRWDPAARPREIDCYAWYYSALALYQYKDHGGMAAWKAWNQAMQAALIPSQRVRADGCVDGSWDPELDRWGYAGGRVYLTAVNTMTLEVYYRYKKVLGE